MSALGSAGLRPLEVRSWWGVRLFTATPPRRQGLARFACRLRRTLTPGPLSDLWQSAGAGEKHPALHIRRTLFGSVVLVIGRIWES